MRIRQEGGGGFLSGYEYKPPFGFGAGVNSSLAYERDRFCHPLGDLSQTREPIALSSVLFNSHHLNGLVCLAEPYAFDID